MILIKTGGEIERMRKAGKITGDTLKYLSEFIKPGVTTDELNTIGHKFIVGRGAKPSFLKLYGYPKSICTSVDDVVVHGIPGALRLTEGMIISIDVGAQYAGYHSDAARTYAVGAISEEKRKLTAAAEECFNRAAATVKAGVRVGDISAAVQTYAETLGYGVVRALEGHGIGRDMHEDPGVPNFGRAGTGVRLAAGTAIAIEPMITAGAWEVTFDGDGFTCRTKDGSAAAHHENTIIVTEDGYENLTI